MTDAQITEIFGSVPYFADQVIESSQHEQAKLPFTLTSSWCYTGSVNIMRICGTAHPEYAGLTWRELLQKGRRMDANIRAFLENPSYYTDIVTRMPGMSLSIVDGKGYVTDDGNHRTCIGRFYLYDKKSPFMHGVHISENQTDLRMYALYERIREQLPGYCTATPVSKEVCREDGDGWATHFYEVRLRIENARRKGYFGFFGADELEKGVIPALRSGFLARFGEYGKLIF